MKPRGPEYHGSHEHLDERPSIDRRTARMGRRIEGDVEGRPTFWQAVGKWFEENGPYFPSLDGIAPLPYFPDKPNNKPDSDKPEEG